MNLYFKASIIPLLLSGSGQSFSIGSYFNKGSSLRQTESSQPQWQQSDAKPKPSNHAMPDEQSVLAAEEEFREAGLYDYLRSRGETPGPRSPDSVKKKSPTRGLWVNEDGTIKGEAVTDTSTNNASLLPIEGQPHFAALEEKADTGNKPTAKDNPGSYMNAFSGLFSGTSTGTTEKPQIVLEKSPESVTFEKKSTIMPEGHSMQPRPYKPPASPNPGAYVSSYFMHSMQARTPAAEKSATEPAVSLGHSMQPRPYKPLSSPNPGSYVSSYFMHSLRGAEKSAADAGVSDSRGYTMTPQPYKPPTSPNPGSYFDNLASVSPDQKDDTEPKPAVEKPPTPPASSNPGSSFNDISSHSVVPPPVAEKSVIEEKAESQDYSMQPRRSYFMHSTQSRKPVAEKSATEAGVSYSLQPRPYSLEPRPYKPPVSPNPGSYFDNLSSVSTAEPRGRLAEVRAEAVRVQQENAEETKRRQAQEREEAAAEANRLQAQERAEAAVETKRLQAQETKEAAAELKRLQGQEMAEAHRAQKAEKQRKAHQAAEKGLQAAEERRSIADERGKEAAQKKAEIKNAKNAAMEAVKQAQAAKKPSASPNPGSYFMHSMQPRKQAGGSESRGYSLQPRPYKPPASPNPGSYFDNLASVSTGERDDAEPKPADVKPQTSSRGGSYLDGLSSIDASKPTAAKIPKKKPFFASLAPKIPFIASSETLPEQPPVSKDLSKSRIQRILERTSDEQSYDTFVRAEAHWSLLEASKPFTYDSSLLQEGQSDPSPQFVSDVVGRGSARAWSKLRSVNSDKEVDFDTVVCGGTLGIFFATALALKGHRVCVVEEGVLGGGEQEWHVSMEELELLVRSGVLTSEDVDAATAGPGGSEYSNEDIVNLGVSPSILLDRVKERFLELGGELKEKTRVEGIVVSESIGSALDLGGNDEVITSRLVLDCMGNTSPISKQQRYGKKPDGVCAVVGSCAGGFDPKTNLDGDIMYADSEIQELGERGQLQYFWDASPVDVGRNGKKRRACDAKTTYMFTYFDADENRPSLEILLEDYFDALPKYQPYIVNAEDDLDFKRVSFAHFPIYKESPLKPEWSRIFAVGGASGVPSPFSFGGFSALTTHVGRTTGAVSAALEYDLLHKDDLAEINAYQPTSSAAWLSQKAMSIRMGEEIDATFVNRLLATNLEAMKIQRRSMEPFGQDTSQFEGSASTLTGSSTTNRSLVPLTVDQSGIIALAMWMVEMGMRAAYRILYAISAPIITPVVDSIKHWRDRRRWKRSLEAWNRDSGSDFILPDKR